MLRLIDEIEKEVNLDLLLEYETDTYSSISSIVEFLLDRPEETTIEDALYAIETTIKALILKDRELQKK